MIMKPIRAMLAVTLAVFSMQTTPARAEDIDIYSGLGTATNVPNVMIVMDNAANFSSSASGASCVIDGVATAMSGTVGGIEQCALYNVVLNLPTNADGSARINLGLMVYNSNNIRDVNNQNCGTLSSTGGCLAQPLIPMDATNKPAFLNWIKTWNTTGGTGDGSIKASGEAIAATVQETWAYYRGGIGVSGRDYSGVKPAGGCQKNFAIFIGNSFSSSGTPGDAPDSAASALNSAPGVTAAQTALILDTVNTSCGGAFTFPTSAHETKGYYADEWARYMYQSDLYSATDQPTGVQSITTYTVGILGASCQADYAATLTSMAHYGGGKYFPTNDYSGLVVAILKILNEVQAVNSVFSSSSLPVSVNAQGTYLNQIYMGMFRPDAGALPRWAGNLKQYQFILDPTSGDLQLGDSIGQSAIDASGTGFLSPNAVSFWTCSRSDNPYLTSLNALGVPNITPAQQALLAEQGQICGSDPANGFWVNFPTMTNSAGKAFDLADGELVEKGGAGQIIRLANLTDNYTTNPGTPRKLYTYCPAGTGCVADLTHASNALATSNANITASMLGSTSSVNVVSLTRAGTTATVATSGNHGFNTGDPITIANAVQAEYNGTFSVTRLDATRFTYTVVEYPPVTAAGSYTASLPTLSQPVTLTRSGNTVTATAPGHGYFNAMTVTISGANQAAYNGNFVISNVTADTFTYTVTEAPPTVAGGGVATGEKNATGNCPAPCMVSFAIAAGGVTRVGTTVTVNTVDLTNFIATPGMTINLTGVVDSNGTPVPEYAGNVIATSFNVPTNKKSFTFEVATSPATPATGTTLVSTPGPLQTISSLTRSGTTVTAVTAAANGFTTGDQVSIGGTPGLHEEPYIGTFPVTATNATTFTYQIATTPVSPATGVGGTAITATRSTGFLSGDRDNLLNWVRGEDNYGDETGPGGAITVRPSVHGDVLHSRPTVINYAGGQIAVTATSDDGSTRTAIASATDVAKIGSVGATATINFPSGHSCVAAVVSTTEFTYSSSDCGDAGPQTVATDNANVVVFYGDNGGVFHAVNGNQINPPGSTLPEPGTELWGFIPSEQFNKLNRLRTNSPQLNLPSTPPGILPEPRKKDYFVDGPTGVFQLLDINGTTLKAHLYLSMRRGGRMIYALDVTDPQAPRFMWKVDNTGTGMGELGQTWSMPKVAKVAGYSNPVVIFGAGYDPNQDVDPPPVDDVMGRGIFVLDAITGALVWKAVFDPAAVSASDTWTSSGSITQGSCPSDRLKYSIAADITLVDRNRDGTIDRMYAADVGGQVWRVDLQPINGNTPDKWKLHLLATLGECATGVCRKFFYPPEVITTGTYDAVILGSGDREHPLFNNTAATGKQNMAFLLKDEVTGNDASGLTTISLAAGDLFDATGTLYDGSLRGYHIDLADGEKVVNAPLVTAGFVFFGTNQPTAPTANACTATLGTARGYQLSPFTASLRFVVFAGGGLPPSPVSGVVNININGIPQLVPFLIGAGNPDCTGADCVSALGGQKPPIDVSTSRIRTYWYQQGK
jgi:type IV pilus assembly protein PilY1